MAEMGDDKYWKTSDSVGFNFDDDEEVSTSISTDPQLDNDINTVFNSVLEDSATLPLCSVISKTGLDLILQDVCLPMHCNVSPIEETIKKLFLGIPCVLDHYRTLEQKVELLEKAVDTFDGNVILRVVLFLAKTLQTNIFLYHLSKKKMAMQHYCNYLSYENKYDELRGVYMSVGNTSGLVNLFYLTCRNTSSKSRLKAQLEKFMAEHLNGVQSDHARNVLCDYKKFTIWQLDKNLTCDSVIDQLVVLLKDKLEKKTSSDEIAELRSIIKISNLQFDWIQINIMAALGMWDKLSETFIKPNIFKKNVIKTDISPELIINALHRHNAHTKVLQDFLLCVSDTEKSIQLGKKIQCHRFVIDKLVENRNRLALIEYKKYLPSQSEDYFHLEKSLCIDKKWKN